MHTEPACLPQRSGLPAARAAGQRDLQRRCLPLNLPFRPRSSAPGPGPRPRQARSQETGRGREPGRGPAAGAGAPPALSLLFLCHYRGASRSSSASALSPLKERGRVAACSQQPPRLQLQVPIPPAPSPAVPPALPPDRPRPGVDSGFTWAPVPRGHRLRAPTGTSSVPSPSPPPGGRARSPPPPSPAHTREACTCEEPGGSKRKRGARLLEILRAHVAQASAPLGWDWASGGRGGGSRHPRPRHAWFL